MTAATELKVTKDDAPPENNCNKTICEAPPKTKIEGKLCILEILNIEKHSEDLFNSFAKDIKDYDWTYLHYGGFKSLIEFENKDFENVKQYGKYLLPYIFVGVYDNIENNFENILGQNWLGVISLIILSLIFIFSYKSKNKKLEMFVMILLIFSTIWFYASITSEERAEKGVPGRYVLPVFVLSSMIFGYGIERIFVNVFVNIFRGSMT